MASGGFSYRAEHSQPNTEINFFPVCVDNFFTDPNIIRTWGLSLPKNPSKEGSWPGLRSASLHDINEEVHITLILKILSSYFDLKFTDVSWDSASIMFQETTPHDRNDDILNQGWIHQDKEDDLAGLIYLTPDANPESGTSLFNIKKDRQKDFLHFTRQVEKHAFYKGENIKQEDYVRALTEHNNFFYEKTRFANIYNRMIMYDSNEYHRANTVNAGNDPRLTLVFFINGIKTGDDRFPVQKVVDRTNFDSKLISRIKSIGESHA